MKFKFTLLVFLVLGICQADAQLLKVNRNIRTKNQASKIVNNTNPASVTPVPVIQGQRIRKCGFATYMNKAKASGYNEDRYEQTFAKLIQKRLSNLQSAFTGTVTIPVIFHSIYRASDGATPSTSTPFLPQSKYAAQIAQMNKDYGNLSGSTWGVAADVRIQFCMAVVDTAGRPLRETGLDRIKLDSLGWSDTDGMTDVQLTDFFDNTIKPTTIWDPYSYFNVWTAPMTTSGLLGYSTFPSFSTLAGLDNFETDEDAGCVIAWESIGSVASPGADATYGYGRTLTHESGHFFGLRHIWGDATCGNDYCADTPPQSAETTGCPAAGTLNGCTPSGPKMFQNYMDYSNDACLNTFTANQATRCQTAMDNSPRRTSLSTSKACQSRAGNAIQFGSSASYEVDETGKTGTCPNTYTYSFSVYVSNKATGAATVTFTSLGGTATLGKDYTVSPASITYTANDNAPKTVTITVIDDQEAEADETIQLGYTISGTGVVAGPEKQTINLTIYDDDVAAVNVNNGTPTKTLLSENFNASTSFPSGWTREVFDDGSGSYTPNQWVISANGGTGTTGYAAHITRNTSTKVNQYNNANISDAYLYTPLIDATGARDLSFSFKWRCLGEQGYDDGYIGFIPEGQTVTASNVYFFNVTYSALAAATAAQTATLNLPSYLSNKRFYLVFNWLNDDSFGSNPPFTIDDVSVTGKQFAIATTTDADTAFTQFSGTSVDYYSSSAAAPSVNRIIATVSGPSQDIGCLGASVQNAGTGKTALVTSQGSYFRTDKVIKLTPAASNTTTNYNVSLYYTAAELSPAWTAAEIPALKMLKVKDGVDIYGTITSADAQLVTPTFTDNSATGGYYKYTGNFTGFSQLMLVSPNTAIPIRLLSFEAYARRNSIVLSWSTAQELNNKGFNLERSTDGVHFVSIAWIDGKINSQVKSDYLYADNFVQANTTYYYRIRQVDINNAEDISSTRQARISRQGISVTVSPVPAKDAVKLFVGGTGNAANLELYDTKGQLVKTWKQVNVSGSALLNTSELPSGIYLLNIILPEEKIVRKIMIER